MRKLYTLSDKGVVDLNLKQRVLNGFKVDYINTIDEMFDKSAVFYFHPAENATQELLVTCMLLGYTVVSLGNAWFDFDPSKCIVNGQSGYYSNSPDEIRWIIQQLLNKPIKPDGVLYDYENKS